MNNSDYEYLRIKKLAMAAGTSPKLAWRRIKDGWNEEEAINKESRTKRKREERRLEQLANAPSFLRCKPPLPSTTPMPKTAGPKLMAMALEKSNRYKDPKSDGMNKYTRKISGLIEGEL